MKTRKAAETLILSSFTDLAGKVRSNLPPVLASNLTLSSGDIRHVRLNQKCDAIIKNKNSSAVDEIQEWALPAFA